MCVLSWLSPAICVILRGALWLVCRQRVVGGQAGAGGRELARRGFWWSQL